MTSNPHIKAGSGAECTEVRTRDSVEAIVAEMREIARDAAIHHPEADDAMHDRLIQLASRLQSAHDAEVGALRDRLAGANRRLLDFADRIEKAEPWVRNQTIHHWCTSLVADMRESAELGECGKDAASRNKGPWREVVWVSPSVQGTHTVRYSVSSNWRARSLFGDGVCWGAFPDDAKIVEIRDDTGTITARAMEGEDG